MLCIRSRDCVEEKRGKLYVFIYVFKANEQTYMEVEAYAVAMTTNVHKLASDLICDATDQTLR